MLSVLVGGEVREKGARVERLRRRYHGIYHNSVPETVEGYGKKLPSSAMIGSTPDVRRRERLGASPHYLVRACQGEAKPSRSGSLYAARLRDGMASGMGRKSWGWALVVVLAACKPGAVEQAPPPPEPTASAPPGPQASAPPTPAPAAPTDQALPVEGWPRRVELGVTSVMFPRRPEVKNSTHQGLTSVLYELELPGQCFYLIAKRTVTPAKTFNKTPEQAVRDLVGRTGSAKGTIEDLKVNVSDDQSMASARYTLALERGGALYNYMVWLPGRSELHSFLVGCQGQGMNDEGAAFLDSVRVAESAPTQPPAAPPTKGGAAR